MAGDQDYDVVVVGAGNAALAAAVSAREQGAGRVVALEKAPRELRGGNTHYSGGLLRFAYDRAEDLLPARARDAARRSRTSSPASSRIRRSGSGPTSTASPRGGAIPSWPRS